MRCVLRALAVLGLATGAWLVAAAPVAAVDAATIDDIGWWARTNQSTALPGDLLYPDVTAGQLLVEGTPEGATAIAALRATLPEDAGSPVLTLRAASSAGGEAAILLACQAGSGWTGSHAGAWDAKPSPDCSASVQGVPSEDGSEWTFALGALQFGDQIDVVLTPGVVAESDGQLSSAFRIVFDRPGADAVTVSAGAAPPPEVPSFDGGAPVPGAVPSAPPSIDTGGSSPSFSVPERPSPIDLDRQPVQAALPPDEQGATATAPALVEQPIAAPPVPASGSDGRALGVLVVLAAGALLWWSSQQPVPERQVLSRFATAATGPAAVVATPEPTLGGLGRFRRERTAPARPLG